MPHEDALERLRQALVGVKGGTLTKKNAILTTVQEVKGKYTVPVPSAIIKLKEIEKGHRFKWTIEADKIIIEIKRVKK